MNRKYAAILIFLLIPLAFKLAPEKKTEVTEEYIEENVNTIELTGMRIFASAAEEKVMPAESVAVKTSEPINQCKPIGKSDDYFTAFRNKYKTELDKLFGAWYLDQTQKVDPNFQPKTETAKFIFGLYNANLLSGKKNDKPNYSKALSMFAQTISDDRKSSTPWYYILHLYEKLKYKESFDYAIGQLLEKEHHSSYQVKLQKEVFKLAKTPEDFAGAIAMAFVIPQGSSQVINDGLKRMKETEKTIAAKIFMKKGSDPKSINDGFDWSSKIYQKGYKILEQQNRHKDFLHISDLKYKKEGASNYFKLEIGNLKTLCDVKGAFEMVSERLESF